MADEAFNIRFKKGTKDRIKKVCVKSYYGISVSDYIRQFVFTQLEHDEAKIKEKELLSGNSRPEAKVN